MSDAVTTVRDFLEVLTQGREGLDEAPRRWFTDETTWENVGMNTATGITGAIEMNQQMEKARGIAALRVDTLAIAEVDGKVLTERVDEMVDADGKSLGKIRCMGIFEVNADGKITAWRDYFDTAAADQGGS